MSEDPLFEPLNDTYDRAAFSCGEPSLDLYIRQQAGQDRRRHLAAMFIMRLPAQPAVIVGYDTLSAYTVSLSDLAETTAKHLGRYPHVPALLLGRLAVDHRYQRRGFGRQLLVNALHRCYHNEIAALVVVDALNDSAAAFYESFGFSHLPSDHSRLLLPMTTVKNLLAH
jgi:ribosomal protein S18 acetylase RimI-like enzyme